MDGRGYGHDSMVSLASDDDEPPTANHHSNDMV